MLKTPTAKIIVSFLAGALASGLFMYFQARHSASIALSEWTKRVAEVSLENTKLQEQNQSIMHANDLLKAANTQLEQERVEIGQQLAHANETLADLQANEPVAPELESTPLVINLRLQLKEQDHRYSLAIQDIAKANETIENQKIIIKGLEQSYQNALDMYANSNGLVKEAGTTIARLSRQNATIKTIAKGEAVLIVVLTVIALVK